MHKHLEQEEELKLDSRINKLILTLINDDELKESVEQLLDSIVRDRLQDKTTWDVPITLEIEVFDPTLSYELTGYRPISKTQGLDFNPEWFCEARNAFKLTGHYCGYLPRSKRFNEFWKEEYKRCRDGYTSHGYTITGDNYFFLNYYLLPIVELDKGAGEGTTEGFPVFFVAHYVFFHYLNLCRKLKRNCCMMKARSMGFSEVMASINIRMYEVVKKSRCMVTCSNDKFLLGTFKKITHGINWLNVHSDLGMFKPELVSQTLYRKSGYKSKVNGLFQEKGFLSEIVGINGSDPSNIRGDRVDLLTYDECGSWVGLDTAIVQGQELCEVQGIVRGLSVFGGEQPRIFIRY